MSDSSFVKQWLDYAENDLRAAKHMLTLYPQPLEIICYHCEQSAEKLLKGYLLLRH